MLLNTNQVESFFSNPDNVHKLYIYEIVNFNNNIESIVSQNTNNFLKIKFVDVKKGLYESCTFSPQLKVLSDSNDVGMKINTDYVFISNDDFSFLEQTKKTYVFTINQQFNDNTEVYFLSENSIKAMNELSDDDLDQIKLDDADNLINLYSIGLQNVKKLEIGKNSTINFVSVDESKIFEDTNVINKITYSIPINSFVQSIQILGTIKNNNVANLGDILTEEQLDIQLDNTNIGVVPLFVKYTNLYPKCNLEVLNFSLSKQLPLNAYKKVISKEDQSFEAIFNEFKKDNTLDPKIIELIQLIQKLILITWVYANDFSFFDKKNSDFVNYYNTTYANKKAIDFNTNLINTYELKYPEMVNTIAYSYFKAICYACSNIMLTPYGASKEELTSVHKNILWAYINVPITNDFISSSFNSNGSFKDTIPKLIISIDSNYYLFNVDNNKNITITNKILKFNEVKNGNYLPIATITKIEDEQYYQVWSFLNTPDDAYNLVNSFYFSDWQIKEETVTISKDDNYAFDGELKQLLPPDAEDIEIINDDKHIDETGEKVWDPCPPLKQPGNGPWIEGEFCVYTYTQGGHGAGGTSQSTTVKKPRPYHYKQKFVRTITFRYRTKYNYIDNTFNYTASQIANFFLMKTNYKNPIVDVSFKLNDGLTKSGWYINQINQDYCFGLLNSPQKMKIDFTDKNNNECSFQYSIKNSFQKIDNANPLTRNKY